MKTLIMLFLALSCLSLVFCQDFLVYAVGGFGVVLVIALIVVVVVLLRKRKGGKKVKMSQRAANFTRLLAVITKDSGINTDKLINVTKSLVKDYVDNPNSDVANLLYKDNNTISVYFKSRGLDDIDASILIDILRNHTDEILSI